MIKHSILTTFLLSVATFLWGASDVQGIWKGSLDLAFPNGQKVASHLYANLRQSGTEITGSAGPSERKQSTIRNGNLIGDRITFEAGPEGETLVFRLVLTDGHLKGVAVAEKGMMAHIDLTRAATAD